ncbi:MAG: BTAD domain-containing putative transcriptional regulator [Chloroflexota bacterium]
MFWPELPEKKAAHNLSQSLFRLREALREKKNAQSPPFLLVSAQEIQFNVYSDTQLDVVRFRKLLHLHHQHNHLEAARCDVCAQWLSQAAELYQGDLLAGFFVPDSVAFEEWRLVQQEELHLQMLAALEKLANYHLQRGEFELVQEFARRGIVLEPWREEAHMQIMWAQAQSGQKLAALKQYETYQRILVEELGIKPAANVTKLYEQIRSGEVGPQAGEQSDAKEPVWLSSEGEHRQVTALVCSQGVQDDWGEVGGCERTCQGIFNRFGGRRALRQGETCLVYFGYPQAYEDAARRAVHAGLAVTAALKNKGSARIGIHTGYMAVGKQCGPRWQDRDLFGKTLEIARGCQWLAEPGEVVITEGTRRLVQASFDLQALTPQILPTVRQPVQIYQVCGEGGVQSRLEWLAQTQRLTAFTGREEELRQLQNYHEAMLQGTGQAVLVCGEAGSGKSRLIWELKERVLVVGESDNGVTNTAQPALWLTSRCLPHFEQTSLYPMIGLLEQLLGFQADDGVEMRQEKLAGMLARYEMKRPFTIQLLSLLLGLPLSEPTPETITKTQREQMRELFMMLLQKRAGEQPLVLVVEDLHWSDPSTIEWLGHVVEGVTAVSCFILLTIRPGSNPGWLAYQENQSKLHQITLKPLSPKQAARMVADLADDNILDAETHRYIVAQTDGIPLFVEELTKSLIEYDSFGDKAAKKSRIPMTLQDSLAARLDRLGKAKETAQWAAVLGREFSYSILQACVPFDEQRLQDNLIQMVEAELLSPMDNARQKMPTRYAFRHALIQDAAYASLLKRTRYSYHRHVAETLEAHFPQVSENQPEILAEHFASAHVYTRAVDFWLRAGERARSQGALLEAKSFFNRVFKQIQSDDNERRWLALLGREDIFDLRAEREAQKKDIDALIELAETSGNDMWRVDAYKRLAIYGMRIKDFELQLHAAEASVLAARRMGNVKLEVNSLAKTMLALIGLEEWDMAEQVAGEILTKLSGITDDVEKPFVLGHLAYFYGKTGDLFRALSYSSQAAEAAHRAGDPHTKIGYNMNNGCYYSKLGRYAEARETLESGLAMAELVGYRTAQNKYRYNLSYALWYSGDREAAQAMGKHALLEFETNFKDTEHHASCLNYLGIFAEESGDWQAAVAYLAEACNRSQLNADKMEALAVEARCLLALGRHEEARQLATDVWAYLQEQGSVGMDFPSRVFLCVADVFKALALPGMSESEVLSAGYDDLMRRAEKISDATWRQSFLENAVENKAVVERWEGCGMFAGNGR